jgi:hypothetical protein
MDQSEEIARLRGVMSMIQALAEKYQFDTGAIARGVVQQIRGMAEDALASLPSPAEAGEKAKGWQPKCYICGQGPWDSVQGFASHKCQRPAAPSEAKAGERCCRDGKPRHCRICNASRCSDCHPHFGGIVKP